MLKVVCVLAALVLPVAATAATSRERTVAGPVRTVGIAGTDVAYAIEYRPGCHEVRAWHVTSRADRRVARHCFQQTSTGSGVAGVATTRGRTLWLTYTGGNYREWSLWTKGGKARARRIAFETALVDDPAPVVLGRPWEGSLPYAIGRTVVVLEASGARRFTLTARARVLRLSAHSRGYAAVLDDGRTVLTISLDGRPIREHVFDDPVETAALTGRGLIAKLPSELEIRGGTGRETVQLPRGARFLGYSQSTLAYGVGRELRLRMLSNGHDRLYRTLAPRFQAELGRRGLVWASGRTLGFSIWARLWGPSAR